MKRFPVLWPNLGSRAEKFEKLGCPRTVPWDLLEACVGTVAMNHAAPLPRIAERGGLEPSELVAVLEQRMWKFMSDADAIERLKAILAMRPAPALHVV
jgi:hypothetical protein